MHKNIFFIWTAVTESVFILLNIFMRLNLLGKNFSLTYSVIVFFLFETYMAVGFLLEKMIPYRKKILVVMFANTVILILCSTFPISANLIYSNWKLMLTSWLFLTIFALIIYTFKKSKMNRGSTNK